MATGISTMLFHADCTSLRKKHTDEMLAWLASLGLPPKSTRAIALFETDGRYFLHVNSLRLIDGEPVLDWATGEVVTEPSVFEVNAWPDCLQSYPTGRRWMPGGRVHVPVTAKVVA